MVKGGKKKIICRCQSSSLGLFSTEKHTDCSRNVDEPYLKDLKKCLQNLFLKENKCNFVCMYCMDDVLLDTV